MAKQKNNQYEEQIKQLEERTQALEDQLKRAVADYHNLEKRIQEGRSELSGWVTTELIRKLLPILHHLDLALAGASEAEKESGWFKGVQMSVVQLKNVLKEEGLEEIVTAGQFDPNLHEAVDTKEGEDNMILETVEKGYSLNGKIVKPAKVIVGRKGETN